MTKIYMFVMVTVLESIKMALEGKIMYTVIFEKQIVKNSIRTNCHETVYDGMSLDEAIVNYEEGDGDYELPHSWHGVLDVESKEVVFKSTNVTGKTTVLSLNDAHILIDFSKKEVKVFEQVVKNFEDLTALILLGDDYLKNRTSKHFLIDGQLFCVDEIPF